MRADDAHRATSRRARRSSSPAATAGSTREVIRLGEAARGLGYDAICSSAPHTSLPSQRELAAHYAAVADAVGMPIVLYNYPARAGVEIGYECLDAIADLPTSSRSRSRAATSRGSCILQRRYAGRIEIMCGCDDQAADYFSWGVRSWLAGTANVLPRHHVVDHRRTRQRGQPRAGPSRSSRRSCPGSRTWRAARTTRRPSSASLTQGIDCGPVRAPLLALTDDVAAEFLGVLDEALAAPLRQELSG